MNQNMPITVLKGIGPKKAEAYKRLGVSSVQDMIEFYPKSYEISNGFTTIADLRVNETAMVRGRIITCGTNIRLGRLVMTTARLADETGDVQLTWFNQTYLAKQMKAGREVVIRGKFVQKKGRYQFVSPKVLNDKDLQYMEDKGVLPVYGLTKGLNQKEVRLAISEAINFVGGERKEFLPAEIRDAYDLMEVGPAANQVHYPDGQESLSEARRRLVFDEFLFFQLGLMMLKDDQVIIENQYTFPKTEGFERMMAGLPYKLTGAQDKVMQEILADMNGPSNMNRLVQGDVGSGKTVVAALAVMLALDNGYQTAVMAPTEVLAKQHYLFFKEQLEPFGIEVGLLVGSMTAKQKREAKEAIADGSCGIVIGTHAVIQEGVDFSNLALVITDEQHRFGVRQREVLAGKGNYPHVLVMSATPIPRTLALILYGDMDVSIIDEMPPGRQPIETYSVTTDYRNRLYQFMLKEIEAGRQCYVVCPKVEEGEDDSIVDVVTYAETVQNAMPAHVKVACLHGKMKAIEKNTIMQAFVDQEIHIVVATTVIEVGINVPNATVMMIENAERFGLAQLHQLRGRVGRGQHKSYCILVTDSKSDSCKKRMKIMTETNDGFVVAEKDLEIRGHGDMLGVRQSGMPNFKLANIAEDAVVLKDANEVAHTIRDNPEIMEEEDYQYLDETLKQYFHRYMDYIAL